MAQNFDNHRKFVPGYHFGVSLGLAINLAWSISRLRQGLTGDHIVSVILAAALIGLYIYARTFALRVQDRVIRLEMQVRLAEMLPLELRARVHEFSPGQLIAMRFASDAELPTLAAKVLADRIENRDAIKKLVQNWKPDHLRV